MESLHLNKLSKYTQKQKWGKRTPNNLCLYMKMSRELFCNHTCSTDFISVTDKQPRKSFLQKGIRSTVHNLLSLVKYNFACLETPELSLLHRCNSLLYIIIIIWFSCNVHTLLFSKGTSFAAYKVENVNAYQFLCLFVFLFFVH